MDDKTNRTGMGLLAVAVGILIWGIVTMTQLEQQYQEIVSLQQRVQILEVRLSEMQQAMSGQETGELVNFYP